MSLAYVVWSAVSGAVSGSGIVYFLKDRWLEGVKASYAKDLEVLKDSLLQEQRRIQALIDRSIFVSRAQFDTEFNAMKDIFGYATETRLSMEQVRPMSRISPAGQDQNTKLTELFQKLETLVAAFNLFSTQIDSLSPFYPQDLYTILIECRYVASQEITQIMTGGDETFGINWLNKGSENIKAFSTAYHRASVVIRERLDRLSIITT